MANGLIILAYHRVLDKPDPLRPGDITVDTFERHMRMLARYFNVLPLTNAVSLLQNQSLPSRAVSITFDDGYADNYSHGWPILRRLGLSATIFIATGFLDGGRMWNDTVIESIRQTPGTQLDLDDLGLGRHETANDGERFAAINKILQQLKYLDLDDRARRTQAVADRAGAPLPDDLMLESGQVKEMSQSAIEIGAHTISHPILKATSDETAKQEITEGKKWLEEITGNRVRSFAYPNGAPGVDYETVHVDLVRNAGFDCAVSTSSGVASQFSDVLQLPRFGPWTESSVRFGLRMLRMYFQ